MYKYVYKITIHNSENYNMNYSFNKIHHKPHINYKSLESKLLMIKLLWRAKKDRHLQYYSS